MNLKRGDKVRVTNLSKVRFGNDFFDEGDIAVVRAVEPPLNAIFVEATKNVNDHRIASFGIDNGTLVFVGNEIDSLTKIEEENTLNKLVAVAKRDSAGHEIHEHQEFRKGDVFDIITEPIDLMTTIIFGQLRAHGDADKAILVNFGSGFMVFFKEEDEQAFNFNEFFDQKEAN